jgi:hypothetical protein
MTTAKDLAASKVRKPKTCRRQFEALGLNPNYWQEPYGSDPTYKTRIRRFPTRQPGTEILGTETEPPN